MVIKHITKENWNEVLFKKFWTVIMHCVWVQETAAFITWRHFRYWRRQAWLLSSRTNTQMWPSTTPNCAFLEDRSVIPSSNYRVPVVIFLINWSILINWFMAGLIYYVMSLSVCQELGNITPCSFLCFWNYYSSSLPSINWILYLQRFTWCRCESDFQRLQTSQ